MIKLPEGEAKRRHDERNRLQNERLKEVRRQARIAKGKPAVSTPEWRKEQMRKYQKERRAKEREAKLPEILARREAKKAATAARVAEKQKIKNAKAIEKRRLARENGKTDMRGKHIRPIKVKPVKPVKLKVLRRKEKPEPKVMANRKIELSELIPLKLDARTTIYVKPGTDIEATRQRYLSRKMS